MKQFLCGSCGVWLMFAESFRQLVSMLEDQMVCG